MKERIINMILIFLFIGIVVYFFIRARVHSSLDENNQSRKVYLVDKGLEPNISLCPPHQWTKVNEILEQKVNKTLQSEESKKQNLDSLKKAFALNLNSLACSKCGLIFGDNN
jgi:apolipoprotein N-acyltransferase